MAKTKEVIFIPLSRIEPDPHQPRKNFNPERLGELMKSITKYGILNPLVVEQTKTGTYMLIDGERRYRAAKELKLKEVPVLVAPISDAVDRLVQQFHLQEQHEGWSALEKAVAVGQLSKELGVSIEALGETLALNRRTIGDYVAFSKLLERKEYEKAEVPIHYASKIQALKTSVKRSYDKVLGEDFTPEMERQLELAIITRVKKGTISNRQQLTKIADSVRINPKSVETFIKSEKVTPEKLFVDSQAKVAYYYRNILNKASGIASDIKLGLPMGLAAMYDEDEYAIGQLKLAHKRLGELLAKV